MVNRKVRTQNFVVSALFPASLIAILLDLMISLLHIYTIERHCRQDKLTRLYRYYKKHELGFENPRKCKVRHRFWRLK